MLAPDSRTGPSVTRSAWRLWAALAVGIGLAPLAQWVVVPPLTLLLARRAEGVSRREP
jgi:hypothetical protein